MGVISFNPRDGHLGRYIHHFQAMFGYSWWYILYDMQWKIPMFDGWITMIPNFSWWIAEKHQMIGGSNHGPSPNHWRLSATPQLRGVQKVGLRCATGYIVYLFDHVEVSWNMATPKSSILMGFSLINHPAIGMPQLKKNTRDYHVPWSSKDAFGSQMPHLPAKQQLDALVWEFFAKHINQFDRSGGCLAHQTSKLVFF